MLTRGDVAMVTGPGKAGKTGVCTALVREASTGGTAFGLTVAPMRVLVMNLEDSPYLAARNASFYGDVKHDFAHVEEVHRVELAPGILFDARIDDKGRGKQTVKLAHGRGFALVAAPPGSDCTGPPALAEGFADAMAVASKSDAPGCLANLTDGYGEEAVAASTASNGGGWSKGIPGPDTTMYGSRLFRAPPPPSLREFRGVGEAEPPVVCLIV